MIENSLQLKITIDQVDKLIDALGESIKEYDEEVDPRLFIATLQGIQSQIDEMKAEVYKYLGIEHD